MSPDPTNRSMLARHVWMLVPLLASLQCAAGLAAQVPEINSAVRQASPPFDMGHWRRGSLGDRTALQPNEAVCIAINRRGREGDILCYTYLGRR
jgi:hypothetical protein